MPSDSDIREQLEAMKCAIEGMADTMKKHFGAAEEKGEEEKDDMAGEGMKFAEEAGEGDGVHIDIDSHGEEKEEEEGEEQEVIAMRSTYAIRSENARLKARMARLEAEMKREKFAREIDILEQEGYRIPESQRGALLAQLQSASDPVALLESWRDLFARDPIGTKIDMSRASLPKAMSPGDVGDLVKQFAGKPEEFAKAINSRMTKR